MIKPLVLSFFALTVSAAGALAAENITDPCPGTYCSSEQKAIADDYANAYGLGISEAPRLFSGACFHKSPSNDGKHEHHAAILLHPTYEGDLIFRGVFSFFAPENPYKNWTTADGLQQLPMPEDVAKHSIERENDFAFIDFNPGQDPVWRYWLRETMQGELLVIGHWGDEHQLLCRLTPHTK